MRVSLRRIGWLTTAGLAALYFLATVYIDRHLRLLVLSAVLLLIVVATWAAWLRRMDLASWYCRRPLAVRAAIAGSVLWCIAAIWFQLLRSQPVQLPAAVQVASSVVTAICGTLAWPIGAGGWLFVWGYDGPPHGWLEIVASGFSLEVESLE